MLDYFCYFCYRAFSGTSDYIPRTSKRERGETNFTHYDQTFFTYRVMTMFEDFVTFANQFFPSVSSNFAISQRPRRKGRFILERRLLLIKY